MREGEIDLVTSAPPPSEAGEQHAIVDITPLAAISPDLRPAAAERRAMSPLVAFSVDERAFALPLGQVERALRAVAVTPLPHAPAIVCGVVNIAGRIVPVINLRRRFGLCEKEIGLADQLLIANTSQRPLAMIVDTVLGVVNCEEKDFVAVDSIVAGTNYLRGIVKSPAGMVLIHDLDTFLSLEEVQALDNALMPGEENP